MEVIMKKLVLLSLLASALALSNASMSIESVFIDSFSKGPHPMNQHQCARLEDIFTQNYKDICLAPVNLKHQKFIENVLNTNNTLSILSDAHKNILGFITYKVDETNFNSMNIELLAIDKKHQKMGYGSTLLEYATDCARKLGVERMDLLALSQTLGFYNKHGFKPIKNFDYSLKDENRSVTIYKLEKMV